MAKAQEIVLGSTTTGGIRNTFQSLVAILTTTLVVTAIYLTQEGGQWFQESIISAESLSKCNLFSGKWVFDNISHPLYKEQQCTYMSDQLACEKFGRKDLSYQNWRWKPHHCDLPRSLSFPILPNDGFEYLLFIIYIPTCMICFNQVWLCF